MEKCTIGIYPVGTSFFRRNQKSPFEIDENIEQDGDWSSSIYFWLKETDLPKFDDSQHPYPMEFKNKVPLPYIRCTYECFRQGGYDERMPDIIEEIEELLGKKKSKDTLFMKWLGECGYAFQCYNNKEDDAEEIVIPFSLFIPWEITYL